MDHKHFYNFELHWKRNIVWFVVDGTKIRFFAKKYRRVPLASTFRTKILLKMKQIKVCFIFVYFIKLLVSISSYYYVISSLVLGLSTEKSDGIVTRYC